MLLKLNKSKTDMSESMSISFEGQTVIQMVNKVYILLSYSYFPYRSLNNWENRYALAEGCLNKISKY